MVEEPQLFEPGETRKRIRLDSLRPAPHNGADEELSLALLMTVGPQDIVLRVDDTRRMTIRLSVTAGILSVEARALDTRDPSTQNVIDCLGYRENAGASGRSYLERSAFANRRTVVVALAPRAHHLVPRQHCGSRSRGSRLPSGPRHAGVKSNCEAILNVGNSGTSPTGVEDGDG